MTKPSSLKISAKEDVEVLEVVPGTPADSPVIKNEEQLPKEEIDKRQKIVLEYTRLLGRYVEPHNNRSRWVAVKDLPRVLTDGKDLVALCNIPRGNFNGIAALAHSQIDDKDPLRFFVLQKGMVIINPVIFNHTKTSVDKREGCLSFPYHPVKIGVQRYHKITMIYQTLEQLEVQEPRISAPIIEGFTGGVAHVFQHEISHLNGVNIYDENYSPESCEGLGDGMINEEDVKLLFA